MARKAARAVRKKSAEEPGAASPPAPPSQLARSLGRVRWDWLAAAISLLALAWLLTEGDWDFFRKPSFLETFYDGQARSLLHGRIDVPPGAIGPEAFMRDGKAYGYFGPTPALFRLPLELLLPGMYGRWNCLSMLLASALILGALFLLMSRLEQQFPPAAGCLRHVWRAGLILAVAIGSTMFFVSAERKMYQESILWGSALAFTEAVCLICYLLTPKTRWLVASCVAGLLAFFARISSGSGPLVSLALVDAAILVPAIRVRLPWAPAAQARRAAIVITSTLVASVVMWAGLNYWKYGVIFTSQPIALNKQFDRERVERVKGDIVSLYNLPITFSSYLTPDNIEFESHFPWVFFTQGDRTLPARYPQAHFDTFEPFVSLPAGMPELFLAALAGSVLCLWRCREALRAFAAPLCGAIAGCGLIFAFGYVSYRYLQDMFPWLALATAITMAWILALPRPGLRRALASVFAALTLYAICVNVLLTVRWQSWGCFPIRPEKRIAFTELCSIVDYGGLAGVWRHATHWHRYISAASFQRNANIGIDHTQMVERGDQPVIRSQGNPPYLAEYDVNLPSTGQYEIAIDYAAAIPSPVHLRLNGQDAKILCAEATGGWMDSNRRWNAAGPFRLTGGANRIALASDTPFPPIYMLRVTRVE